MVEKIWQQFPFVLACCKIFSMESRKNLQATRLGYLLRNNALAKIFEILLLFGAALLLINILKPHAGENLVFNQAIVWIANIFMLAFVWIGLRFRGQSWADFGLRINPLSSKEKLRIFLKSLLVFILAIAGFILGSIVMANITGIPEGSDMSGYAYLQNNIPMLILTLIGVYIVSSFGEEVIYRAFLINRLTELGLDSKVGQAIVVIVSALIFGFVHFDWGPMGIAQTAFMGLVLGICYLKLKKNLWILILAHAYMDTILMVQMYLASN